MNPTRRFAAFALVAACAALPGCGGGDEPPEAQAASPEELRYRALAEPAAGAAASAPAAAASAPR